MDIINIYRIYGFLKDIYRYFRYLKYNIYIWDPLIYLNDIEYLCNIDLFFYYYILILNKQKDSKSIFPFPIYIK